MADDRRFYTAISDAVAALPETDFTANNKQIAIDIPPVTLNAVNSKGDCLAALEQIRNQGKELRTPRPMDRDPENLPTITSSARS